MLITGTEVPNYDIKKLYQQGDVQSMLVNSERFGSHLASTFSKPGSSSLDHNVVLMKNHGFTAVGGSIKQAVYRAVYTHINANVQSNAIMLRNADIRLSVANVLHSGMPESINYLDEEQVVGCMEMNDSSQDRPWGLWCREVEVSPLYVNETKDFDPTAVVEWT